MKRRMLMFLAACFCLSRGFAAGNALTDVKITTDRSVDSSTRETIARDLCKPGMTDEQKAIALFDWFERSVYHRPTPADVNMNPHKVINVYGGVVCGTQGCIMADLCRAAGFEAKVVNDPGHTYYEVRYGDLWHGFDTMMRFYIYTRGEPRQVASFSDLEKDPSLVKDAVAEDRACPGLCYHGDDPMWFTARHKNTGYQPNSIPGLEKLSLVPGQRITWYWYNVDKLHPAVVSKDMPGFSHSCAKPTDMKNPVNWFFWAPYYYDSPGCSPEQYKRRMYANGVIVFEPDLSRKEAPAGFTELTNLSGPGLAPVDAGQPGVATIQLHSPYVLVSGKLTLKAAPGADLSAVAVATSKDGKTFAPVAGKPDAKGVLDLTPAVVAGFNYDFGVKLTLPDAKAALSDYKLELVFMHNKYVLPFLVAGANAVKFHAANPEQLAANPVGVHYTWQEGPEWDSNPLRESFHKVKDAAGSQWYINVAGDHYPRMKTLTIANGVWTPKTGGKPVKTVKIPLKYAQHVNFKGEVAPAARLLWPKAGEEAGNVTAGAAFLTGDFQGLPASGIAAARLLVPFAGGSKKAPCKVGAVVLTAPVEAGKAADVKGLANPAGTAVVRKQPEDKAAFDPLEVVKIDITGGVKGVARDLARYTGFALRVVPDRSVDDGYSVGCEVAPGQPIVLELDIYELDPDAAK